MNSGGRFGVQRIRHFNGGLFSDELTLPLQAEDIPVLEACSRLDWGKVEPSILGTLFERGLDPAKRSQLGAHYTPRADMERVVDPVMMEPLRREWVNLLAQIAAALDKASASGHKASLTKAQNESRSRIQAFLTQVRGLRVLDPACGSGNFLYVALERLHSLEKDILYRLADLEGGQMSLDIQIGPHQVFGLELNPYAAELARVTVWIGHLQWMIQNGFGYAEDPILQNLENIQQRDAILELSGPEPQIPNWPEVDFIVGNPPFLGSYKQLSELGESYVAQLRQVYGGLIPGGVDLVCYWFERSRQHLVAGKVQQVGFVSTNSIRGGSNRAVLDRIVEQGRIFTAWSDQPWVVDGAAVRISLVCFGGPGEGTVLLDGQEVEKIYANLTAGDADLTQAVKLPENANVCFEGIKKYGAFDIPGNLARQWLKQGGNPNGRPNSDVLKPWLNAADIVKRSTDTWIIDFTGLTEDEAELYDVPFNHIQEHVKSIRAQDRNKKTREEWWLFERSRIDMRKKISPLSRYIVSPIVSKYRIFIWMQQPALLMNRLDVISREDDISFGILHSRFHELWSLSQGSKQGVGNDPVYSVGSCFETFPFPPGLTPNLAPAEYSNPQAEAIGEAARRLNELRENWLNPPELVQRVPEVVPGYPERILPKDAEAEKELKKRTLTNLYNACPAWLVKAHARLDAAVAAAYGWPADLPDQDVLACLLALNRERSQ
jgi:type II restriction/modification system DNA methylase subunit YeeA